MIAKTFPGFSTWKAKETHGRFLLIYRKHKTERAELEN